MNAKSASALLRKALREGAELAEVEKLFSQYKAVVTAKPAPKKPESKQVDVKVEAEEPVSAEAEVVEKPAKKKKFLDF